jgi:hypothetical protein
LEPLAIKQSCDRAAVVDGDVIGAFREETLKRLSFSSPAQTWSSGLFRFVASDTSPRSRACAVSKQFEALGRRIMMILVQVG